MRLLFGKDDPILKPHYAALILGAVVALSLLWTQKGIHVSGVLSLFCSADSANRVTMADELLCSPHSTQVSTDWIIWMASGIFVGAFFSSYARLRSLRFHIERGRGVLINTRMLTASIGGIVVGFGAALAGGCTSSLGLTGSSVLSVAAFAFLGLFFIGGFAARFFWGRFWNG